MANAKCRSLSYSGKQKWRAKPNEAANGRSMQEWMYYERTEDFLFKLLPFKCSHSHLDHTAHRLFPANN